MTEYEDRFRAALDDLAATVPPSANPAAEHRRRVEAARAPSRRPMLAAAAAAIVVAGVIAPSALSHTGESTVDNAAPTTAPTSTETGSGLGMDDPYRSEVDEPVPLAEFTENGVRWSAYAVVERVLGGVGWAYRLCVLAVPSGEPVTSPNWHPNSSGCLPAFSGQSKVETRAVLGDRSRPGSGPLPGLLLLVTVPEVWRLDVQAGDGKPVPVNEILHTPELSVYRADFPETLEGFGFVAKDRSGQTIASGIS